MIGGGYVFRSLGRWFLDRPVTGYVKLFERFLSYRSVLDLSRQGQSGLFSCCNPLRKKVAVTGGLFVRS